MTYFEPKDFLNIDKINQFASQRYEQGRADGINDLLLELPHKALISRKYILDTAEQMKEQKNE